MYGAHIVGKYPDVLRMVWAILNNGPVESVCRVFSLACLWFVLFSGVQQDLAKCLSKLLEVPMVKGD